MIFKHHIIGNWALSTKRGVVSLFGNVESSFIYWIDRLEHLIFLIESIIMVAALPFFRSLISSVFLRSFLCNHFLGQLDSIVLMSSFPMAISYKLV
jgi:hypothetical protein